MPIYEFLCEKNRTLYSFYSPRILTESEVPRCPHNKKWKLQRAVSSFSITGRHKEEESFSGDDDDSLPEAAMAELEKEFSGMDEENPDPRQMGRLMRRMAEITGEPLHGSMEEMVRKMEEGRDLEALEEEMGDLMGEGDEDAGGMDAPFGDSSEELRQSLRRAMRNARKKVLRKDPQLYDVREYLDESG